MFVNWSSRLLSSYKEEALALGPDFVISTLTRHIDALALLENATSICKVAELFELASSENENSEYALAEVTMISQLILQRSSKGKINVCRKLLTRRIKWWNDGRLDDLPAEAKYLQQKHRQHMVKHRTFHPITASMRYLSAEGKVGRILSLKDTLNCQTVRQRLEQVYPIDQDLDRDLVLESSLQGSVNHREALFSDLDALYVMRTCPLAPTHFTILSNAIQKELIPKILGKVLTSSGEEVIYGLPLKNGGLGILDFTIDTALEYSRDEESNKVKEKLSTLQDKLSLEVRVALKFASEKGASSWLRMLYLNDKESRMSCREFRDAISRVREKLLNLHPQNGIYRLQSDTCLDAGFQVNSLIVDCSLVRAAIFSFPSTSASGCLGLRPEHLQDLLTSDLSGSFLQRITSLVNTLLDGGGHESVARYLCGANLIALVKEPDGVRPIAPKEVEGDYVSSKSGEIDPLIQETEVCKAELAADQTNERHDVGESPNEIKSFTVRRSWRNRRTPKYLDNYSLEG
ncbi:hypothetical protein GJ496_010753 [Pomphorhynchus laevis]|nr:hypothetical protein GJ496_010753 [Pomphorhynchus laevis]